jgi:hypothetical protein
MPRRWQQIPRSQYLILSDIIRNILADTDTKSSKRSIPIAPSLEYTHLDYYRGYRDLHIKNIEKATTLGALVDLFQKHVDNVTNITRKELLIRQTVIPVISSVLDYRMKIRITGVDVWDHLRDPVINR